MPVLLDLAHWILKYAHLNISRRFHFNWWGKSVQYLHCVLGDRCVDGDEDAVADWGAVQQRVVRRVRVWIGPVVQVGLCEEERVGGAVHGSGVKRKAGVPRGCRCRGRGGCSDPCGGGAARRATGTLPRWRRRVEGGRHGGAAVVHDDDDVVVVRHHQRGGGLVGEVGELERRDRNGLDR